MKKRLNKGGSNMADLGEEVKKAGVFGGVELGENTETIQNAGTIRNENLPVKAGFWSSFKAFWLQEIDWNKEIKVELTPYQQKVEDEIKATLKIRKKEKDTETTIPYVI